MTITLPPDIQRLVTTKVADGLYQSAEEVVLAALRRFSDSDPRTIESQRRVLWAEQERCTAEAYANQPDDSPAPFDSEVWED